MLDVRVARETGLRRARVRRRPWGIVRRRAIGIHVRRLRLLGRPSLGPTEVLSFLVPWGTGARVGPILRGSKLSLGR